MIGRLFLGKLGGALRPQSGSEEHQVHLLCAFYPSTAYIARQPQYGDIPTGMMPSMARQARLPVVSWNFIALQETILRPNHQYARYFRR